MASSSMHRQVFLLASAQALFQTASVMVMTVGGLAGSHIALRPELATVPIAAMFLGTAAATFPASMWMTRVGRRAGFVLGALLGVAGGAAGAAGEVADDAFRSRAISLVLAGGVVAALAGPMVGRFGAGLFPAEYAGSFLLLALVSLIAAGVLSGLRMPAAKEESGAIEAGRTWQAIVSQLAYLVALFGAATGYGVMILAMTATPLAMAHHHHDLSTAATVIQLHVLGMFLPSFITGSLIARFGVLQVMLAGVVILAGHVLLTLTGTGFGSFASALIFLGVGWNFLYIGGTTLVATTYTPTERGKAQATNDMTIFAVGLASSLSAAALLQTFGWQMLNVLLLPWLALAASSLLWLGYRQKSAKVSV